MRLESWNFQSHPQTSRRGMGLEIEFNCHGQYLVSHAFVMKPPIKTQKERLWRAPRLVNLRCGESGVIMEALCHIPHPMHLSHLTVLELYPFVISW